MPEGVQDLAYEVMNADTAELAGPFSRSRQLDQVEEVWSKSLDAGLDHVEIVGHDLVTGFNARQVDDAHDAGQRTLQIVGGLIKKVSSSWLVSTVRVRFVSGR